MSTIFKNRYRIHKSDIKTNNDKCGTAKLFNGKCKNNSIIFQFLSVHIFEQVYGNATDIEKISWHRVKNWERQLFITTHDMNSVTEPYCEKRKKYRK